MDSEAIRCVVLADRHHGLSEGIRGLLESEFEAVVMVADERSLIESAFRLQPKLVVADLALTQGEHFGWLERLLKRCPESRVIVISSHDEPTIIQSALDAGAAGYVRKSELSTKLMAAIDAVMAGERNVGRERLEQKPPGKWN